MKVLVTGGAGYVGSHTALELMRAGHEVVVFDNFLRGRRAATDALSEVARAEHDRPDGITVIEGDLTNYDAIEDALRSDAFDAVMHFAGVAFVSESMRDPGLYYTVNTAGGLNLLNAMKATRCRRLIMSSTCAVYGVPTELPIAEDAARAPVNPYGESKLCFETMMSSWADAYGFKTLALRYFNAAGCEAGGRLGELRNPETRLIPSVLRVAAGLERAAMVFGGDLDTRDGSCERDYIHVEDLARVHKLALERLDGLPVRALNVGTGQGRTVLEVIEAARAVTGKPIPVIHAPRRVGDPPALVASPERAEELLGFRAEKSLEDMISSTWEFMQKHLDQLTKRPKRFGEAAVELGLVRAEQIDAALAEQKRRDDAGEAHELLGLLMVEMDLIDHRGMIQVLRKMNPRAE